MIFTRLAGFRALNVFPFQLSLMTFKIFTAVKMRVMTACVMTPYSLVDGYHFSS